MDLRLVIVGITLRQLLHRLGIGQKAGAVIDLLIVGIHRAERVDIIALPLGLGTDGLALRNYERAFGKILRGRCSVWIPQQA